MVLILNTQNAVSGGKFVAKYSFVTGETYPRTICVICLHVASLRCSLNYQSDIFYAFDAISHLK